MSGQNNNATWDFEQYADGTALVPTSPGSPDQPNSGDGGGIGVAQAAAAYVGSRGVKFGIPNSGGVGGVGGKTQWYLANLPGAGRLGGSWFMYLPSAAGYPSITSSPAVEPILTNGWVLNILPSGHMSFAAGGNGAATTWTSTTVLPLDTWLYVEVGITGGNNTVGGTGRFEFNLYTADAMSLVESYDSGTGIATPLHGFFTGFGVHVDGNGNNSSTSNPWYYYVDRFMLDWKPGVGSFPGYQHNFESGTAGASMSTTLLSKPGKSLDTLTLGTGSTATISNAQKMHGSNSMLFSYAASVSTWMAYTLYPEAATRRFAARAYWYADTLSSSDQVFSFWNASGSVVTLGLDASLHFKATDAAGTVIHTSSATASAGTWYRVEAAVQPGTSTTTGVLDYAVYVGDSTTAIWSGTDSAANLGTVALNAIRFGRGTSTYAAANRWYDDIAVVPMSSGLIGASAKSLLGTTTANGQVTVTGGGGSASSYQLTTTTAVGTVDVSGSGRTAATAAGVLDVSGSGAATEVFSTGISGTLDISGTGHAISYVPAGVLDPFSPFHIMVYDKGLHRQQPIGDPVRAVFTPRILPAVASAEIEVRATDSVNEWLQEDGARVTVYYRSELLFSGPVVSYQGSMLPGGTITYQFESDDRVLGQTLGWVAPTQHLAAASTSDAAQTVTTAAASYQGYYDWGHNSDTTLSRETAIKRIIADNFTRLGRVVTIDTDLGRGGSVAVGSLPQVRFDPLDTIVAQVAADGGLGVRVYHGTDDRLHADVFPLTTWSQVLTYEAGVITEGTFSIQTPAATRAIVGGPGQDIARAFYEVDDSNGYETGYGQIIEVFKDSTSGATVQWPTGTATASQLEKWYPVTSGVTSAQIAAFTNTLTAAGQNALDQGKATSGVDVKLSETPGFHYGGTDGYHVGDTVTVGSQGQTFTEQITECTLTWDTSGFVVVPTLGQQTNDPNVVLMQAIHIVATHLRQQATGR